MKKKFGIVSLLLALALMLVLLPGMFIEAEAAAANRVTVYGYHLDSGYYLPTATWRQTTTKPSGSYFYYNNGTLTLHNITVTPYSGTSGIYADGDLVVNLSGTNKIAPTNDYGIRSTGTLKFTGSGSLTVSGSGYDAIRSSGNMEFAQTGTVTATATGTSSSGVECGAKLTIGGNLNATAESSYAIWASGDISMTKGTVNATGNCTYSAGGIRSNGAITVSGGTLNVTSKSDGIISKYDFWQKAGNVTVNADWNGIIVESATNDARINEGTLTVTAVRDGIKARKFYMNGGHGYIKSTNTASDSNYYAVKLAENTSSYFYRQASVKASGSTTTSSSGLTNLTYANLPTYDYVFFTGYIAVNGVELRDGYYLRSGMTTADISKPSTGGYAYYSGNTLTLNNFEGSSASASGIDSKYDLNIVLTQGSTNKLATSTTNGTTYRGINVRGTLKIKGLGQLTLNGGQYAIYSTGSLTIGTSVIKTYGSGIYSGSTINLDGAMLDMTNINSYSGMACAIKTNYNLYIDGGAIGIYAPNTVTLSGTSSAVGVTGISANYIDTNASMGLEVSGNAIQSASKVYISGGTLDIQVIKDDTYGVEAKEISISGGTVNIGGGSDRGYAFSMHATDKITISGGSINVDFDDITFGSIESDEDMVISGGSVSIKARSGLSADNLTISGGTVDIASVIGSFSAKKATFTGGMITTRCTDSDARTYSSASVSSENFIVADHLAAIGSDNSSGKGYEVLTIDGLKTYHYLAIGEFVMLHDVILPTGHFLESGNSKTTVSTTAPSSGDYASYKDGVLTLCDYEYSGNSVGIRAFGDLTVELTGGSKINHIISHAGDLTFKGTGALEIKRNMANDTVNVIGDVYVQNGLLTVDGSGGNGVVCNHFYLNGGKVWVNANFNGIEVKHGLTVNGGAMIVKSTGTTNDTLYRAINSTATSPVINISSGLNHMVGTTSAPDSLPDTDFTEDDCDFVALGKFVMVRGVILFEGNYLKSGSNSPVQSGAGTSYAYLDTGNCLILSDYTFSGSETGVASNVDLTIVLKGTNKLDCKTKSVSLGGGGYYVQINNGISVRGNLTIKGRTTATDSLDITAAGAAIRCDATLNIMGDSITAASSDDCVLYANDLNISGGTLTVRNTRETQNDTYTAIELTGNMTLTGGIVNVTGSKCDGIVLQNGNLSVQGGELTVNALYDAVKLHKGRLNMNGGFVVLSSKNTDSDGHYCALSLAGYTSDYYNVAMSGEMASLGPTKDSLKVLEPIELFAYDYVQLGNFIEIGGKTVKSGYSIKNDGTVVSGNAGSGSAYYVSEYAGNTLTLNGFKSTVTDAKGILSSSDLTIKVIGSSSITSDGTGNIGYSNIVVAGNLTFTGTQPLTLNSDIGSLEVTGNVVFSGGDVTMDQSLISGGDVTISSGIIRAKGYHYAIYAENVTVNGGQLFAQSDNAGKAIKYAADGSFTVAEGLRIQASTTADGELGEYDAAKHDKYKKIAVTANIVFTLQPVGGEVTPGQKLNVSWGFNFTPVKTVLVTFTPGPGGDLTVLGTSVTSAELGASPEGGYYQIRGYYNDEDFVWSDRFYITEIIPAFTTQPAGGKVLYGDKMTVSWQTNFTPCKIVVGEYNSINHVVNQVEYSGTTTSVELPANKYGYVVIAYYNAANAKYSNKITITETVPAFTTQPVGGEAPYGGKYTVHWATNFTPKKLQVLKYSKGYCTGSHNLDVNATTANVSAGDEYYIIRSYYSDSEYVDSNKFYVTEAAQTYTVTFKVDTTTVATKTVEDGKTVTAPADPTQSGYTFLGWYNGSTKFNFATPITGNITLTAKFEAVQEPVNPFPDVGENNSFKQYILWCYEQGIIGGDKQGNFNPDKTVTRGQFIIMLWRAAGKPEPTQYKAFPDVSENSNFYTAVCWAVEKGITNGKKDGNFGVNDPCTRGHVALFLYRYAGQPPVEGNTSFPDVTGGTYYNAVCWMVENGITNGQKDGTFGVGNACKRTHVTKFLYLYLNM